MDALPCTMTFAAQDLIDVPLRRADHRFRARHRRPNKLPDIASESIQREEAPYVGEPVWSSGSPPSERGR
jgi:hypothetical protein